MPKRQHTPRDLFNGYTVKRLPKSRPSADSPAEYNDHTFENGRRYRGHKSEFPWPNDAEATNSYSSLNTVWTFLLKPTDHHLINAPITPREGTKLLDWGARGMSWMSKTEDKYPGVRISVIDPGCAWMYPTDITVHHELEGEWPFTARQAFHYIRCFALGGMIADYKGLYDNSYRHLLPGGWLEVRDNNLQFLTDSPSPEKEDKLVALRKWERLMAEAAEKFGKPINMAEKHKALMEGAGFTEVKEEVYKIPFGAWMEGEPWTPFVETSYRLHMKHGLEGYTLRLFTKTLGWSLEDTKAFISEVKDEIADSKLKDLRLYSNFHLVIGKKPESASRKP
ncbi:hypothetical protein BJX68DRAFT_231081 [Aspergillus pseudodeflectus]|uniref:S-adenosyl-L-methionine-dependent methyltransferase n=1 Tax=Aspergillus pseudodeflectus TaxID=176178 RepID=A0ABR4KTV8_9EURO